MGTEGVRTYIFIPSREPDLCVGSYRADGVLGDEGDYAVDALVEGFCSVNVSYFWSAWFDFTDAYLG